MSAENQQAWTIAATDKSWRRRGTGRRSIWLVVVLFGCPSSGDIIPGAITAANESLGPHGATQGTAVTAPAGQRNGPESEAVPPTATAPPSTLPVGSALGIHEPEVISLEQRLRHAVRTRRWPVVQRALELGADVTNRDELGRSAVHVAVGQGGQLKMVKLLLRHGGQVDAPDRFQRTPLSMAAGKGHLDIVDFLIGRGAKIDSPDQRGRTPLFHAVLAGHPTVVERLLTTGAQLNGRDRFGDTPLIAACAKGFDEIAQRLIAAGADRTLRDQEGRTARMRAAPETPACSGGSGTKP